MSLVDIEIGFPNKWWLDIHTKEVKCDDFYEDWDQWSNECRSNKDLSAFEISPWLIFDTKEECIAYHLGITQAKIDELKSLEYKLLAQKHQ